MVGRLRGADRRKKQVLTFALGDACLYSVLYLNLSGATYHVACGVCEPQLASSGYISILFITWASHFLHSSTNLSVK